MTVEGVDDAEAVLLARIRETVGADVIVSTSMDLHGNVSRELAHMSDLITCYRMAPHEDHMETKERAARHLRDLLTTGAPRPVKAWIPVPVLLAVSRPRRVSSPPGACTRPSTRWRRRTA